VIRFVSAYCGRTRILDFDHLSLINPDHVLHSQLEESHAEIRREISSGRFHWFRLRIASRHGAPSRPSRVVFAHGERSLRGMQHVALQPLQTQKANGPYQVLVRAGECGGRTTEETDRAVRFAKRGRRLCSPRKPIPRFTLRRRASSCSVDPKGMDRDLVLIFAVFCPKISTLTVSPL
jgi:hypothetical protein